MKKIINYLLPIFNYFKPGKVTILRAFGISLFSLAYSLYAVRWTDHYPSLQLFLLELPLLWIIYTVFHFVNDENRRWRRIVCEVSPLLIIFISYYYYDYFYRSWLRTPRFMDMKNIISLVGVWGVMGFLLKALPIIALFVAFIMQIRNYYQSKPEKNMFKSLGIRAFTLILVIVTLATPIGKIYLYDVVGFEQWSESYNMQQRGRISSMFYYKQKYDDQKNAIRQELTTLDCAENSIEIVNFSKKPNTYIVLLESFFDPADFKQFKLGRSMIYEGLNKYLHKGGTFDYIQSPIFGAGTAQAEFEILTGAPTLQMLDTIEFNSMHGSPTYSICKQFLNNGYRCEAVVATSPGFYNSVEAYKSLNFEHVNYLNADDSCLKGVDLDGVFPHDSEILPKALAHSEKFEQPFFGYVLTMFGHRPYKRNIEQFPDLVVAKDAKGEALPQRINDCINGVYYKTKDVCDFLDSLYEKDPTAVVLIASDHLPDICRKYSKGYLGGDDNLHYVPALLLDGGKPVSMKSKTLYEAHYELLSLLSKEPVQIAVSKEIEKKRYLQVMKDSFKEELVENKFLK